MSTLTQNFGIVLPEGNDIFNPLTFNNDAFTKVDAQMKKNQDAGLTSATHNLIDGVNQILREIGTCPLFIFTATSDYEASQTFAVDGVTCTFRYADGTAPTDGAFATNQTVLCYLNGTIINLISTRRQNAGSTSYTGAVEGANNVKSAIDTLQGEHEAVLEKFEDIGSVLSSARYAYTNASDTNLSAGGQSSQIAINFTPPEGYRTVACVGVWSDNPKITIQRVNVVYTNGINVRPVNMMSDTQKVGNLYAEILFIKTSL